MDDPDALFRLKPTPPSRPVYTGVALSARVWQGAQRNLRSAIKLGRNPLGDHLQSQQRRVVDADLTPGPLETIADCTRWGAWVALSMATGVLDRHTAQQTTNAINQVRQSLKDQHEEELAELRTAVADLRTRLV